MNNTKDTAIINRLSTKDYAYIGQAAALMAICSWITIPSVVPFTMQTFAVFLTVGLLGGKRGTIAVVVYLLLGAVGLPVFAGFSGGLAYMAGPTGGYIVGFIGIALVMWFIEKYFGTGRRTLIISMVLGLLVCYAFGTAWFVTVYTKSIRPMEIGSALSLCVIPYIIPDVLKIALAVLLCRRIKIIVN